MTTALRSSRWTLLGRLPSGHRLFELTHRPAETPPEVPRYAIADESGRTPSTTEDGELWLATDRDIVIFGREHHNAVQLPLMDSNGDPTATVIDMPTALILSAQYGMRIKDSVNGKVFVAAEVDKA